MAYVIINKILPPALMDRLDNEPRDVVAIIEKRALEEIGDEDALSMYPCYEIVLK
jgi:hypothetical protein